MAAAFVSRVGMHLEGSQQPVAAVAAVPHVCRPSIGLRHRSGRVALHAPIPSSGRPRTSGSFVCRAEAEIITKQDAENGAVPPNADAIPTPVIKIDNEHDPFATIVCIEYGDRLGELLDTVAALQNLNLNVRRAKIGVGKSGAFRHKFYITDSSTSEKVLKSRRLEEIRLTILNNLLLFHPESGEELAWGIRARKADASNQVFLGARSRKSIDTVITVDAEEDSAYSKLFIQTLDRPGLLVEIVKVLKDININVVSAEVDTEGKVVNDTFYVTYHGEPLNSSMVQLVTNALQYYLSLNEVEKEESY